MIPVLTDSRCERLWQLSDTLALAEVHRRQLTALKPEEWQAICAHQEHTLNGRTHYNAHPLHGWFGKDLEQEYRALVYPLRWQLACSWMPEAPRRVLDFGTQCGAHAIEMAKRWRLADVFGRDVVRELEPYWAQALERYGAGSRVQFSVGDYASLPDDLDLIWAGEVFEHIPEPYAALKAFEAALRPGGMLILSTPLGPWEAQPGTDRRLHVAHYDAQDWMEIAGHRPKFRLLQHREYPSELGFSLVTWEKPGADAPLGRIDYDRKLWAAGLPVSYAGSVMR